MQGLLFRPAHPDSINPVAHFEVAGVRDIAACKDALGVESDDLLRALTAQPLESRI